MTCTWDNPQIVRDYTRSKDGPTFPCRVRVLALVGDFPAQAKALNHVGVGGHCNCPFCKVRAETTVLHSGTSAAVFPISDGLEARRSHDGMTRDMGRIDRMKRMQLLDDAKEVYNETGIKGSCVWIQLPYVKLPWFRTVDWMHLIGGLLGKHIFPLLSGDRTPGARKSPKERRGWDDAYGKHFIFLCLFSMDS